MLGATVPRMHVHHTKWDNPAATMSTADSPSRHQRVCQLIKLGLNTIAQSFHTMPSITGMATTVTPEHYHLGSYSRVQATARDAASAYLNAVSYTQQDGLLCLGKAAIPVLISVCMRGG